MREKRFHGARLWLYVLAVSLIVAAFLLQMIRGVCPVP
jgi:hypothetical protein